MRIVNVIELQNGVVDNIESYVDIQPEEDTAKSDIVQQAEDKFIELAVKHGCYDTEEALDNGKWTDGKYEVIIIWSNVNV